MGVPTGWEFVVLLLVLLLLFGAKRLPDTARGLGRSLRIFKAETRGLREDDDRYDAHEVREERRSAPVVRETRVIEDGAGEVRVTRPVADPSGHDVTEAREVREPRER